MSGLSKKALIHHLEVFINRLSSLAREHPELLIPALEDLYVKSNPRTGPGVLTAIGGFRQSEKAVLRGNVANPHVELFVVGHNNADYSLLCTSVPDKRVGQMILASLEINRTEIEKADAIVSEMMDAVDDELFEEINCSSFTNMMQSLGADNELNQ